MKITEDVLKSKGIAYVQKFPYDELSKTSKNGKRHYNTPDGRQVPSVTTVLSATKDMNSDAQQFRETRERTRTETRIKSYSSKSTQNGKCYY